MHLFQRKKKNRGRKEKTGKQESDITWESGARWTGAPITTKAKK